MLIGVGGSGKQSLSRLAGFISGCVIEQLSISSRFSNEDLKEELRRIYLNAGVKVYTLLIMTDAQIVDDKFLVSINNILASGNVPGLLKRRSRRYQQWPPSSSKGGRHSRYTRSHVRLLYCKS